MHAFFHLFLLIDSVKVAEMEELRCVNFNFKPTPIPIPIPIPVSAFSCLSVLYNIIIYRSYLIIGNPFFFG